MTSPMQLEISKIVREADDAQLGGDIGRAKDLYRQALTLDPCCLEAHNKAERIGGAGTFTYNFGINAQIDPRDDIFHFFERHERARNPVREYLSDGWRTLSELFMLLESIDRRLAKCGSFLEFASGFGRFTRHLVKVLGPSNLCVSDVVDGSVDFLRGAFGVSGFYSSVNPAEVRIERKFEIVFVLSLFTHLPERLWQPWIATLMSMLQPGGVLIFTTHGERASRDQGVTLPESGYAYFSGSESRTLDESNYGVTFTSEQYVRASLNKIAPGCRIEFFPSHFWAQDAFAVFA